MNIKYMCRKEYRNAELMELKRGDIVSVSFAERKPKIVRFTNSNHVMQDCKVKIPFCELNEYFILYDCIEEIDAKTAMLLFSFKFSDISGNRELAALKELRHYINAREKHLTLWYTEDIQQGPQTTVQPHIINAN